MSNILCGKNLTCDVEESLSSCAFVVTDSNLAALYPELLNDPFVIDAGEKSKNAETLLKILTEMQKRGVKRRDTVAAFGGGVVGDITGLAAALYMRGVDWVNIPTSLLAMVDSGIGGKTAVDHNGIKNLVGAFHMPRDIIINADFLNTLPEREWLCGKGELIKTCILSESAYGSMTESIAALQDDDLTGIYPLIRICVDIKNAVVTADPEEKQLRKILNVGHTVGHALESTDGYKLSHGEYIIKGMMTEAAMCRDIIEPEFYGALTELLSGFSAPPRTTGKAVCSLAMSDKKNVGDTISLMIPLRPGSITEVRLSAAEFANRYDRAIRELRKA